MNSEPPTTIPIFADGRFLTLEEIETRAIDEAITRNHFDKRLAALELGVALKTIYNKLHRAGRMPARVCEKESA